MVYGGRSYRNLHGGGGNGGDGGGGGGGKSQCSNILT